MDIPFSISEARALLLLLTLPPVIFVGLLSVRARPRERGRIWASTALRSLILLCITLAIAGLQWITAGGPLNVVFLVDRSASVSQSNRDATQAYVKQAIASMGPDDRAGVVLFGEDAVVDRALSADTDWSVGAKQPPDVATNIAGAIQLAAALFPEGGSRRLVLLSDGVETVGQARDVAKSLSGQGIQLSVVPLGNQATGEVAVNSVTAPGSVAAGQQLQVSVDVRSTASTAATLSLYDGTTLVGKQDLQVQAGDTKASFTVSAQTQGFHVFKAHVASVDDRYTQNNDAEGFTIVRKPPLVLILATAPENAQPFAAALKAGGIDSYVTSPYGMPLTMAELDTYDAVVLANDSAQVLGEDRQAMLQSYVRDEGHGLIMLGGDTSFGAGGYLRSPLEAVLPVAMDVRTSEQRASIAMTYVIDKSGSMGRCHCGTQQAFEPSMRTDSGDSKIDLVKQAVERATTLLNSSDEVGVLAEDTQPHWLAPLQPLSRLGEQRLQQILQPIDAQGDTTLQPGLLSAVQALEASHAQVKHIVLLTDGWTQETDFTSLLSRIAADNITLSTVGVGEGSASILPVLAAKGGGKFYSAPDVKQLPDILLKETIRLAGSYFVEKPFQPLPARASPILDGIDTTRLPPLLGYDATTPKPDADLVLTSPEGDPILAQWQYGLGRSVAWTSDVKGQWATNWVTWPDFSRFAGQMVGWTLPQQSTPGLESSFALEAGGTGAGQDVAVRVDSTTAAGSPRNSLDTALTITATNGVTTTLTVLQQSPGVYSGRVPSLPQGAYAAAVEQRDPETGALVAAEETGFVVPYPSEFALSADGPAAGQALLSDIAQLGQGATLDMARPAAAFTHNLGALPRHLALWPWLLLLAVLLFPLDVAVRRLSASPRALVRLVRRRS